MVKNWLTKTLLVSGIVILSGYYKSPGKENKTSSGPFIATELLGRPTDKSVTVNALADVNLEVYFEYGAQPGIFSSQTPTDTFVANIPIEVTIDQLQSNTKYYYRMRYREPGDTVFLEGNEYFFHTQRSRGSSFTFTIQSDSHLRWALDGSPSGIDAELYTRTLQNAAADNPDFHIDLGDAFTTRAASTYEDAVQYHLEQRPYFGLLCHSAPLFLVIGNHEHEVGWEQNGTADNRAIWATRARKLYYVNPVADKFYTGDTTVYDYVSFREGYYSWVWGDALFVVLDPFWNTAACPHNDLGTPPEGGSGDGWDWTLGFAQYTWFKQTLKQSSARFKFVFAHHMTAGAGRENHQLYGRGGIEGAHLWEWGGYNNDSTWGFDAKRPGWEMPIHQLMAANDVTIFFHGHDHAFVKQELDSVVYQEVPMPGDKKYSTGFAEIGGYVNGDILSNSGHLRATVSQSAVTVDYIRAYRVQDEDSVQINGDTAYSYTLYPDSNAILSNGTPEILSEISWLKKNFPNPFCASTTILFQTPKKTLVNLAVYNGLGSIVTVLLDTELDAGRHHVVWDGHDRNGRRAGAGVYSYELRAGAYRETKKMLLLH